jgi:hypothetical protein
LIVFDQAADADSGELLRPFKKQLKFESDEEFEKYAEEMDEKVDKGIRQIMVAIGLAIGFAWEQCFDKSVDAIAEESKALHNKFFINPSTTKLFLAMFCSALLVPAWRLYVLPYMKEKGWRYGWAINLHEKYCEGKHHPVELDHEIQRQIKHHAKQIKRVVKVIRKCHNDRVPIPENYQALPASEKDTKEDLLRKNAELKNQLLAYRRIFDEHMQYMGNNLKIIHETMDRIPP